MDWVGTAFTLSGLWLIGSKKRTGFLVSIIGCIFGTVFGLEHSILSIAVVNIIFILLNIRGWSRWSGKRVTPGM
jgi:hypothetical protein